MVGIAALMDFLRKPKKSQSADIEISIKIKCDSEKTASEKNKIKHK
jgi:effector-binding domain-containing protein